MYFSIDFSEYSLIAILLGWIWCSRPIKLVQSSAQGFALRIFVSLLVGSTLSSPSFAQGASACPAGQTPTPSVGFAIEGFENNESFLPTQPAIETEAFLSRPILVGPIAPDGTANTQNGQFTVQSFFNSIDLYLTNIGDPVVPENSPITLSLAQSPFNNGQVEVFTSADGQSFTSAGTIGFGGLTGSLGNVNSDPQQTQNLLRHITFPVPAGTGGARFVRVDQLQGGFRVDGVMRTEICGAGGTGSSVVIATDDTATGAAGASDVVNVVTNDTLNGAAISPPGPGSTTNLQVAAGSSLPAELTFDALTGEVGIALSAANGVFQFQYQLCETSAQLNCDTAMVTVTVNTPAGGGSVSCPANQTPIILPGAQPAASGFETNGDDTNPPPIGSGTANAILSQPILPAGAGVVGFPGPDAVASFFDSIDFDLTGDENVLVPPGAIVTLAVAEFPGNTAQFPLTTVLTSPTADVADATVIGTLGFGGTTGTLVTTLGANTVQNDAGTPGDTSLIRHVEITIPAGGARFVRIDLMGFGSPNGFQARGAQYQDACQVNATLTPELVLTNTVEVFDPSSLSVPGADVVYTIRVQNIGSVDADSDSVVILETVPPELSLVNLPFQAPPGTTLTPNPVFFSQSDVNMDFQFGRDVGFSNSTTAPAQFADCTDTFAGTLNPQINFICLNPKGVFAADPTGVTVPEIIFQFRARIQ